jgi:hypothetical protein
MMYDSSVDRMCQFGLGELDDADQPLGEELGDGEVEAAARSAFVRARTR